MSETIFKVSGMDCTEETIVLRKSVGVLPGSTDVKFNLLNGIITVKTAEGAVDDEDILAAVKRAGLNACAIDNIQAFEKQHGDGCVSSNCIFFCSLF